MKKSIFLVLLFLLPSLAFAADFAKDAIFLSKTDISGGNTIFIHTVLSNTSDSAFDGSLTFLDGKTSLGSVVTPLAAYQAGTFSIAWKATTGSHSITVDLYDSNKLLVGETQATFFITSSNVTPDQIESSLPIESAVRSVLPAVAPYIVPAFTVVDTARAAANTALTNATGWAQTQLQVKNATTAVVPAILGEVKGTSTVAASPTQTAAATSIWGWIISALLYILTILRYVVTHIAVFYPVLVLIFFYILWRLFRGVRRR